MENYPTDFVGKETLEAIHAADKFNYWMFSVIQPYCQGNILEIGSGIGNISSCFLKENASIYLSDIRADYCQALSQKFPKSPNLLGIEIIDLADPMFGNRYNHLCNKFDTVFALNVLEHIENQNLALQNASKLLCEKGRLIILVPAYQKLYCRFDEELGHYRRYTRKTLLKAIREGGFSPIKSFYFNLAGIAGWLLFGKLLGRKQIEKGEMNLYNTLVPIFKIADAVTFHKIGLSVICIAQKN